ncbi:hypothetical protein Tco_0511040 [Tanacetum coccineum]
MANEEKKSIMETFAPNDKVDYYSGITSITVNGKNAYELKIIDLIKLPNVDHDKLRVVVFPISLAGGARRWFDKTKESITCWVDLTVIFFRKYYWPSRIEGNNTLVIKWDPANLRFEGWLAIKFVNYKKIDTFTKGALWDYWKMGGDEIEVSDESSDLEECWSDKEETIEIFKIETNFFDYETPLCLAFNEFNYLLKVDPDLLTKDIMGFKTYKDYKDDWIYEWNENVPWVYDKPWLDNGIWKEPKPVKHDCKPFNYKTGCSEWPTCNLEWYEALEDSKLKDEALRNKAILEGLISDDESSNDCWKRWKSHEIYYHNYDEGECENETHEEGHELCSIKTREVPICQKKRYKMIKYSFKDEEEYVAAKEDEYDDLTITSEEACRAYQEIFRMMDEGWMDLGSKEISTNIGGEFTNLEILKCWSLETSRRLFNIILLNKLNMENLPSKYQGSFSF